MGKEAVLAGLGMVSLDRLLCGRHDTHRKKQVILKYEVRQSPVRNFRGQIIAREKRAAPVW